MVKTDAQMFGEESTIQSSRKLNVISDKVDAKSNDRQK
jgi:hypothetical protein